MKHEGEEEYVESSMEFRKKGFPTQKWAGGQKDCVGLRSDVGGASKHSQHSYYSDSTSPSSSQSLPLPMTH